MASEQPLKIVIDHEACIGDGACVECAPDTFVLDDDSVARVIEPVGDIRDDILEAARACPLDIITVIDEETGEQLYPKK